MLGLEISRLECLKVMSVGNRGGKKKKIHKRPDTGRGKSIRPSLDTSTVCRGLARHDLSGRVRKSTGGEKAEGCQITQELL